MDGGVAAPCRITVIDDNQDFLDLMQDLLSERYEVAALSGRGVTPEAIADSRPDLVMVDLHLDGLGLQGWEIVTLMRAHRYLRSVPIVVCSADARGLNGRAEGMLDTGNTAVLHKPFSLEAIEEVIRQGLMNRFPSPRKGHGRHDGLASLAANADARMRAAEFSH